MRIITSLFLLCLFTAPAMAEQKILQSGMQHIIVTKPKAPEKPTINTLSTKPDEQDEQSKQIWNKYKALAAGNAEDSTEKASPATKAPAAIANSDEKPASQNGIAGILSDYRKNKKQQSEMKTLRFDPPAINKSDE